MVADSVSVSVLFHAILQRIIGELKSSEQLNIELFSISYEIVFVHLDPDKIDSDFNNKQINSLPELLSNSFND